MVTLLFFSAMLKPLALIQQYVRQQVLQHYLHIQTGATLLECQVLAGYGKERSSGLTSGLGWTPVLPTTWFPLSSDILASHRAGSGVPKIPAMSWRDMPGRGINFLVCQHVFPFYRIKDISNVKRYEEHYSSKATTACPSSVNYTHDIHEAACIPALEPSYLRDKSSTERIVSVILLPSSSGWCWNTNCVYCYQPIWDVQQIMPVKYSPSVRY